MWKGHQDSRFTNYVAIDSVEMAKPELISYPLWILFLRIFHDFLMLRTLFMRGEVCHQQDDINENGCEMLPKNLKNSGILNFLLMKYVIWVDYQSL